MPAKIERDLWLKMVEEPNEEYNVIVQLDDDPSSLTTELEKSGLVVYRTYRMFKMLAVSGSGEAVMELASDPRVVHIGADQLVQAC